MDNSYDVDGVGDAPNVFDVVAIDLDTNQVRILATEKSLPDANTISKMAISRRGVEEKFYAIVHTGMYVDGDQWRIGKERVQEQMEEI